MRSAGCAAKKPLVVVVDSLAASGAYITALAGDYIVAKQTSLVGSIGVLFEYPNFTDLLDKIGVKVEIHQIDPAQGGAERLRADQPGSARGDRVDHQGFLCLVQRPGAGPPPPHRRPARGGRRRPRVHRAPGTRLKLVDEIGDERTAIAWLAKEKNIAANLPVRDYRLHSRLDDLPFLHAAAVALLDAVGLGRAGAPVRQTGRGCRRSSGSILTVCWRFGNLRRELSDGVRLGGAASTSTGAAFAGEP